MGITLSFRSVPVLVGITDNESPRCCLVARTASAEVIVPVAGPGLVALAVPPLGCLLPPGEPADWGGPRLRSMVDERDAGRLRQAH